MKCRDGKVDAGGVGRLLRFFFAPALDRTATSTLPSRQPLNTEAPPLLNTEGLPPLNAEGLPPLNTEAPPPLNTEGPPPLNSSEPPSNAALECRRPRRR
jgi:hypothetical protein